MILTGAEEPRVLKTIGGSKSAIEAPIREKATKNHGEGALRPGPDAVQISQRGAHPRLREQGADCRNAQSRKARVARRGIYR